ncbi:MAG: hypothetical protein CO129_08970 [Ignavibacteriales bacterium CG_4_9_14_3_um_filter_34_10]|nr:MAG: hypothetical protein CO129_08970 [Ignavibacteriales bacterium CG_4_9_14_3_um_filter_34_10]
MSVPKMTVKLRIKNGIPFAIETLTGLQFRCGVCGKVFWHRDELDRHLLHETPSDSNKLQFPELDKNINVRAIYSQDIRDLTNPKYPRLVKGDKLFSNTIRICNAEPDCRQASFISVSKNLNKRRF